MSLSEFQNQYSELCRMLLNLRSSGRTGHAYLFIGDDSELAGNLARAWLQGFACQAPKENSDACNTCRSCLQFRAGSYPNLQVLEPKSKLRQILIDDVRQFEHQLQLTSGRSSFKAGLIVEADRLNEKAQNAFLKTLEEPPGGTIIVLATSYPQRLLPTIRSRCQTVSLLKNRRSYPAAVESGLFPILAAMNKDSGATTALKAAKQLREIFSQLYQQAKDVVEEESHEDQATIEAIEQDKALQKRLKELQDSRLTAEYRGLRSQMTEAIHTWYMQKCLIAEGLEKEHLPHPELLEGTENINQLKTNLAGQQAAAEAAEKLIRQLNGNMDEKLALQAFCLEVCEKS